MTTGTAPAVTTAEPPRRWATKRVHRGHVEGTEPGVMEYATVDVDVVPASALEAIPDQDYLLNDEWARVPREEKELRIRGMWREGQPVPEYVTALVESPGTWRSGPIGSRPDQPNYQVATWEEPGSYERARAARVRTLDPPAGPLVPRIPDQIGGKPATLDALMDELARQKAVCVLLPDGHVLVSGRDRVPLAEGLWNLVPWNFLIAGRLAGKPVPCSMCPAGNTRPAEYLAAIEVPLCGPHASGTA